MNTNKQGLARLPKRERQRIAAMGGKTNKGREPWNKGTGLGWTDKRGYRWLYVCEHGKRVARREQRVVMEKHIGRQLEPWEIVHHKDGNTQNNAPENLEIMVFGAHTKLHHSGLRRDADARRSMEAFGLMRETLKKERDMRSDLLEALRGLYALAARLGDPEYEAMRAARAAIAKATGRE